MSDARDELKRTSEEIAFRLKDPTLNTDERAKLEVLQSQVAGALMSAWLPLGVGQRVVMACIFLGSAYGLFADRSFMFFWLLLPLFSPRIVGAAVYLLGRLSR